MQFLSFVSDVSKGRDLVGKCREIEKVDNIPVTSQSQETKTTYVGRELNWEEKEDEEVKEEKEEETDEWEEDKEGRRK